MTQRKSQNKKKNLIRPHPLFIFSNLGKYLFLLLIPIFRILFHILKNGFSLANGFQLAYAFSEWVSGAWMDLLAIFLFLTLGILMWYLFTIESVSGGLKIHRGIFRQEDYFLPVSHFTCITIVKPLFLRPFGAQFFRIDLPGGSGQSPKSVTQKPSDLVIMLSKRDCQKLLQGSLSTLIVQTHSKSSIEDSTFSVLDCIPTEKNKWNPTPKRQETSCFSYKPKSLYVFVLAAITSNSFAGLVLITTFITQIGNILGQQFAEMIYGTFEEAARALAFGVPPAAAAVAYLLLFGYLCALSVSIFRHGGFSVERHESILQIEAGITTKRSYFIPVDKISCIDIRRTLITLLLGLSSVFLHTVGYGKYKDDVSALIPCVNAAHLPIELGSLLPEFPFSAKRITPRFRSFFRYTTTPLWCCFGVLASGFVCWKLFSGWESLVFWITLLCFVPSLWFLIIRICDLATAGASSQVSRFSHQAEFTLKYSSGFTLHRVILPQDKVSRVTITQSLFQKGDNRCDLHVISYSEGVGSLSKPHHVRDLPLDETLDLFFYSSNL